MRENDIDAVAAGSSQRARAFLGGRIGRWNLKQVDRRACLSSGRRPMLATGLIGSGAERWHLRHRFDDPDGYYRFLRLVAAFGLLYRDAGRFRPDLSLLAELVRSKRQRFSSTGTLPREWLVGRMMGKPRSMASLPLYAAAWLVICVEYWLRSIADWYTDIDLSALETAEPRRLTQLASRQAYRMNFAGVFYRSRYATRSKTGHLRAVPAGESQSENLSETIRTSWKLCASTVFAWPELTKPFTPIK